MASLVYKRENCERERSLKVYGNLNLLTSLVYKVKGSRHVYIT